MENSEIIVAIIACVGTIASGIIGAVLTPYVAAVAARRFPGPPAEKVVVVQEAAGATGQRPKGRFGLNLVVWFALFTLLVVVSLCSCTIILNLMNQPVCYLDPVYGFVCQ
ncbi:MAG: hypothetical protein KDE04_24125 [Anaerolineales bacterium]|nr:hypothetical protein [Anaerolineales bacterium]